MTNNPDQYEMIDADKRPLDVGGIESMPITSAHPWQSGRADDHHGNRLFVIPNSRSDYNGGLFCSDRYHDVAME